MKIDILCPPPPDIFKDRRRYILIFSILLGLACCGLLLGLYAVVAETSYYAGLETAALALFAGSAVFLTYFGEKLQAYKKLTPPQIKELADLAEQHAEIRTYCGLVAKDGRRAIRGEYEALQEWAEFADARAARE